MLRLVLIPLLLFVVCAVHADEGSELFVRGMQAFKQRDYQQALGLFVRAKAAGLDRPQVNYNLAVTYYKLEQYEQAEQVFRLLLQVDSFAFLANYNLGLCLSMLGRKQEAVQAFQRAFEQAGDVKQKGLAAKALRTTGDSVGSLGFWRPGVYLALGQNDNAGLISDNDLLPRSERADEFIAGNLRLSYQFVSGVQLATGIYLQNYKTLNEYDYAHAGFSLSYPLKVARSQLRFTLKAREQYLNDRHVLGSAGGGLGAFHDWGAWRLSFDLGYDEIEQRHPSYQYLAGSMGRVGLGIAYRAGNSSNRLEYVAEDNQRQDLLSNGVYSDYSPQRHWWKLVHAHRIGRFSYEVSGQFRVSDYDKPNDVTEVVGTPIFVLRADERDLASLDLFYQLSSNWQLNAGYSVLRNRSNIDEFDYESAVVSLGVSWK